MSKILVAYTMKGCGWCDDFKKMLKENNIKFKNRDIEKYKEEYDLFVEAVDGNEFVPAFMIIEVSGENYKTKFYAPERDFVEVEDGVRIIKESHEKFNL